LRDEAGAPTIPSMDDRPPIPLSEFDPDTAAMAEPAFAVEGGAVPDAVVICFFRDAIARLVADAGGREVARLASEMGSHPVYEVEAERQRVGIALGGVGAALAAGWLEELIALGGRRFVVAGSAGALVPGLALGHVIVPTAAVRDEGTSFHYAPPGRTSAPTDDALAAVLATLERRGVPFQLGTTWTTDGFYRETRRKIAARVAEGCLTVEMEAAALFAVARFRGVSLAVMLYAGDDLSGEAWDPREWHAHATGRDLLLRLAIEAAARMAAPPAAGGAGS
jgi:uridine phosphorylase